MYMRMSIGLSLIPEIIINNTFSWFYNLVSFKGLVRVTCLASFLFIFIFFIQKFWIYTGIYDQKNVYFI